MKYDVEANDSLTEIAARARSQQVVTLVILVRKGCTCSSPRELTAVTRTKIIEIITLKRDKLVEM